MFYPLIIKQTKRQIKVLEQYHWIYVPDQQNYQTSLVDIFKFAYNIAVYSSTSKVSFKIVYWEESRSNIFSLNEMIKNSTTKRNFSESKSLIDAICAIFKEVIKSFLYLQA